MIQEKRRFSRVDLWASVEMVVDGVSYYVDHVLDLSLGGCQFPFDLRLTRGDECLLKIYLGEGHDGLAINAQVAWCQDGRVGVAFTVLGYDSLEHIKKMVLLGGVEGLQIEEEVRLMEENYGLA